MTRYPVTGATRALREWAAHRLRERALLAIGYSKIVWKVDPPELEFAWTLSANELALLGSLSTAASTATIPMAGVTTSTVAGGPHEHVEYADEGHTHPETPHGHAEFVHTHQIPDHPDLAAHTALGLVGTHNHDAAYLHGHPYASTGHNHDAAYAHAHPYEASGAVATHAATPHGGTPTYAVLANGATAMGFGTTDVVKVTPTANATYTTTVPAAGKHVHLLVLTSGTTSRTITFGTGFKPSATLATGTVTARVFVLAWVSDGTNLYEVSRTAAMPA